MLIKWQSEAYEKWDAKIVEFIAFAVVYFSVLHAIGDHGNERSDYKRPEKGPQSKSTTAKIVYFQKCICMNK